MTYECSKEGAKKNMVGPFSKKDCYDVKAPATFNIRNFEKTLVTRTPGTKSHHMVSRIVFWK